jgi:hypothetical protein
MTRTALLRVLAGAVLAVGVACAPTRPVQTEQVLLERREHVNTGMLAKVREILSGVLDQVARRYEAERARGGTEPPTCDVLVISGGGDYGAFATGVLRSWGKAADPAQRRPAFDIVLGVSTGALIAPFAFLGDDQSIEDIYHLYTHPKKDWVVSRGFLYFLPNNVSFAEVPGLERDLRAQVDRPMIERLAAESEKGRMVAVNTTDLDDGSPRVWDLGQVSRRALAQGSLEEVYQVLLASSGIPGAFPAREIEGGLYVDGGVTHNIIYGGRLKNDETLPVMWQRLHPNLPPLRLRYWVIVNNWIESPPRTVQPTWVPVIGRSVELAIRSQTKIGLAHLFTIAEVVNLRGPCTMEVRLIAIPGDWRPPVEGVFKEETMRSLAEMGERMGADPSSWMREMP